MRSLVNKSARLEEQAGHDIKEKKLFQAPSLEAVTDSGVTGEGLAILVTVNVFFLGVEHVVGERCLCQGIDGDPR